MNLTPMQYFYFLRNVHGYSTRGAWLSTLCWFCSAEDLARRYQRANRPKTAKHYRAAWTDRRQYAAALRCFKGDRRNPLISHDDDRLTIVVTEAGLDLLRLLPPGACTWAEANP